MVTIAICYRSGTGSMLAVTLASLARHTKEVPYRVTVLVAKGGIDADLKELGTFYRFDVHEVEGCEGHITRLHGLMLDSFIPSKVESEYVMTLDSDCFPIADGWLMDLLKMKDARIVGILHPWAPPPDMNKKLIEWRVRSQHCWENTHVACQMMKTADIIELGRKYNVGDDTGLDILKGAKDKGWKIDGFKLTRCAKPVAGEIDPEFNRFVSLIYGDKVYHQGGWTRITVGGDEPVLVNDFSWVVDRVMKERGAEFLLKEDLTYRFKFDREEAVAKDKMNKLFGEIVK